MGVICTNLANELGHHLVGRYCSHFSLLQPGFRGKTAAVSVSDNHIV
jgi:hypothetical protein